MYFQVNLNKNSLMHNSFLHFAQLPIHFLTSLWCNRIENEREKRFEILFLFKFIQNKHDFLNYLCD
jgi:hypothetical protein